MDETVEAAKKKARETSERVEIPERNTETSTLFANPDGKTLRAELYTEPVRVKKAKGEGFTPIDTTLVQQDNIIKPKAVEGELILSAGADTTVLKSKTAQGTAEIAAPGGKLPKPKLAGNTATYRSAYGKNTDLVVATTPTGFRQKIVIRERPSGPVTFRVPVDLPKGRSFGKNATGQPTVLDQDGKQLLDIRPVPLLDATAVDANAPIDAGKVGKAAVTLDVDGSTLVYTPDAAFLADPAVTYPVTLSAADSDWWECAIGRTPCTSPRGGEDTFVNNDAYYDSWNNFNLDRILVGKSNSGAVRWRSYIRFPNISEGLRGAKVQNADLVLWNHLSNDCGGSVGSGIVARRVTSPWDEMTMQWTSQPSVTTAGQDVEYAAYSPNCTSGAASWAGKEWDLIHSVNQIVQAWVDGQPNYGFQLAAANESDITNWRRYRTQEYTCCSAGAHPPKLTVDFEPAERVRVVFSTNGDLTSLPTYSEAVAMQEVLLATPDHSVLTTEQLNVIERQRYAESDTAIADLLPLEGESQEPPANPGVGDITAPSVIETTPADAAGDVPTDAGVTVTFNEDVTDADLVLKDADGGVVTATANEVAEYGSATLTFALSQPLRASTVYTATVSGATDLWENVMSPHSWSFNTTGPDTTAPMVSGTDPAKDATDVPVGAPVRVTFSEAVSDAQVTIKDAQGAGITGTAEMDADNKVVTFTPQQPLANSVRYTAEVSGAKDAAGNVMAEPHTWSFTTAAPDTTAPTVSETSPVKDAVDARVDALVKATFSEAVSEAQITVKDAQGAGITGTAEMDADNKVVTFTPQQPLANSVRYTAEVSGAKDAAGNVMAEPHTWSFTTAQIVSKTISLPVQTDATIDSFGTSDPGGSTLWAGTYDYGGGILSLNRSYLTFDVSALAGKTITDARLELWNFAGGSYGCGTSNSGIKAQKVTAAWNAETLQWSNQPTTVTSGETIAKDPGGCTDSSAPPSDVAWSWPVTSIMQGWAAGQPNHGLLLRGVDESASVPMYDRGFNASENSEPNAHPPVLKVTYTDTAGPDPTPTATPTSGSDAIPPTVLEVVPANLAENAADHDQVKVTFSEPVTGVGFTLTDLMFKKEVPGTVTMDVGNTVLTFTPNEPLHSWYYEATASGAKDAVGNTMAEPYVWGFSNGMGVAQRRSDARTATALADAKPLVSKLWTRSLKRKDGTVVVPTTTPELMVKVSDPLKRRPTVEVEVAHDPKRPSQGKDLIWSETADVSAGSVGIVQLPDGKLNDGWQVQWRARVTSAGTASPWSDWQQVKVDLSDGSQAKVAAEAKAATVQATGFDYKHMSLEDCTAVRRNSSMPNASFGWQKSTRYNACWSKIIGVGEYIKRGENVRPQVEDGYLVEATTVYHTYLGTANGVGIVNGTGVTPQTISLFTRLQNIVAYDDGEVIPADKLDEYRIGLVISSKGESGSTCRPTSATINEMKAKGWREYAEDIWTFRDSIAKFKANGDTYFRFISDSTDSDLVNTCTLRPRLYNTLDEWDDGIEDESWGTAAIPLWNTGCFDDQGRDVGKIIGTARVCGGPSVAYAPTVRCDELTLGDNEIIPDNDEGIQSSLKASASAAANSTYGVHTGGCIFNITPVFTMSKSAAVAAGKPMDEVIDHIAEALDPARNKNTWPYLLDANGNRQPKNIPGSADRPGQPLTFLKDKGKQHENRKIFSWRRNVNGFYTKGECDLYYWDQNPALRGKQHYTAASLECDEFPFASTYEGAASLNYDYSVKPVNKVHNNKHGWVWLNAFYSRNRIDDKDPFLVKTRS
ncbi:Ig-like domain-containing protein [Planomonospora sp. ID67723]|uniref:Ig-like domain-containing protein n=1 Tax=Planomonospora sp. ID67723 TaxID=2738134 RepID=UPI0018C3D7E2|nr:Ig-like domain-containing protein [Planomonospora sp. ID67723]MBG0831669.1 Ig-like domain-containing protein [Planomonospora sp. ID67723]